jgi:hypothetical protein
MLVAPRQRNSQRNLFSSQNELCVALPTDRRKVKAFVKYRFDEWMKHKVLALDPETEKGQTRWTDTAPAPCRTPAGETAASAELKLISRNRVPRADEGGREAPPRAQLFAGGSERNGVLS